MKLLGIDLAGKTTNHTGICLFREGNLEFKTLSSDEQILNIIGEFKPEVVAIDAPIMQGEPRIRNADRELKKYGALPPTLPAMKTLTRRGTTLARKITHCRVIEVFPTATAKILGIYEKNWRKTAENLSLRVANKHEFDAYLCVLTAQLFVEKKTQEIGDAEGTIIVPQ